MKWYLTKEKTPIAGKDILATDLQGNYSTGFYDDVYEGYVLTSYFFCKSERVKAWAYIEEPKIQSNEKYYSIICEVDKDGDLIENL